MLVDRDVALARFDVAVGDRDVALVRDDNGLAPRGVTFDRRDVASALAELAMFRRLSICNDA